MTAAACYIPLTKRAKNRFEFEVKAWQAYSEEYTGPIYEVANGWQNGAEMLSAVVPLHLAYKEGNRQLEAFAAEKILSAIPQMTLEQAVILAVGIAGHFRTEFNIPAR